MNEQKKIRILLVDDHSLMRDGMASLLRQVEDFEVVGSLGSGEDAVNQISEINPDVLLMDIFMKGMSGIEATRWIKEQNPSVKIILISMESNKENISAGIKSGIDGFLPKNADKESLLAGIRSVMKGERYFSPEITALVFEDFYLKQKDGKGLPGKKVTELSKREEEVLIHIANGKSLKEIGEELFISVKTVETHKSNVLDKLGLSNTAQLVRYAFEHNLVGIK